MRSMPSVRHTAFDRARRRAASRRPASRRGGSPGRSTGPSSGVGPQCRSSCCRPSSAPRLPGFRMPAGIERALATSASTAVAGASSAPRRARLRAADAVVVRDGAARFDRRRDGGPPRAVVRRVARARPSRARGAAAVGGAGEREVDAAPVGVRVAEVRHHEDVLAERARARRRRARRASTTAPRPPSCRRRRRPRRPAPAGSSPSSGAASQWRAGPSPSQVAARARASARARSSSSLGRARLAPSKIRRAARRRGRARRAATRASSFSARGPREERSEGRARPRPGAAPRGVRVACSLHRAAAREHRVERVVEARDRRAAAPPGTSRASPPSRARSWENDHAPNARASGAGCRRACARDHGERPLAADDERHEVGAVRRVPEVDDLAGRRSRTRARRPCPRSCRTRPSTGRRFAPPPSPPTVLHRIDDGKVPEREARAVEVSSSGMPMWPASTSSAGAPRRCARHTRPSA